MPRYRPPIDIASSGNESLPLDTIATIIPRQSKKAGAKNNVHSKELADHELLELATSHGFQPHHVKIDKRDMGISANTTTINDRPALREWLYDALPSGISKVVIFSQEDRAFRDEEEVELNTFIRQVKKFRGWVICGHKVYRMWEEYDADMFRMMCKYAAKYISHHIRGRLLPAVSRAAQRGYYDGRGINIGYLIDYDTKSPTYKRYMLYPPHADLVLHEIFERFAKMPYPSVPALVRAWNASNGMEPVADPLTGELRDIPSLYFPALPPEMDVRNFNRLSLGRRKKFPPYGIDDPLRRGWLLHVQAARRILSNIFYLGWIMRDGQIVRGEVLDNGQVRLDPKYPPLVLHEPLVKDTDLFWYCFERVSAYTIEGVRNPKRKIYSQGERQKYNDEAEPFVHDPWPTTIRNAESSTLLLLGKLHCGLHQHAFIRFRRYPHEKDRYVCKYYDAGTGHRDNYCTNIAGEEIDRVIVQEFLNRLQLTDEDIKGIARAWQNQHRKAQEGTALPRMLQRAQEIEHEIENLVASLALATSETVRQRLVGEMEKLQVELEHIQRQEQEFQMRETDALAQPLSSLALQAAKKSARLIETLRTKWDKASLASRQALMQWVIETVIIAPDSTDRKVLRGSITWRGGLQSPIEIVRAFDRRQEWDDREREVLRLWYKTARWEDLQRLLPGRKRYAIQMAACRMGLGGRPLSSMYLQAIPDEEMTRLAPSEMVSVVADMNYCPVSSSTLGENTLLDIATRFLPPM